MRQLVRVVRHSLLSACLDGMEVRNCITYSEFVFLALGIQDAMCMRSTVICGLAPLYNISPRISHVEVE
jgi:hypothetical protein